MSGLGTSLLFLVLTILALSTNGQDLPTVYEYYGANRTTGLEANANGFFLNGKPIRIFSGAIHYFRIHPQQWRDRMRKLRASGANTLETYIPWNLHEPRRGHFDFGNETNDFSLFLNVRRYVQMAEEEDLLVIFRPGPYICTEWDFGGLPSWLVRDPELDLRRSNDKYQTRARIYLEQVLAQVDDLQWTKGGSIIMYQLENEYGAHGVDDKPHLEFLRNVYEDNGVVEMLITSDSPLTARDRGAIPGVLQTANFQEGIDLQLGVLLQLQPNMPVLVMEYWTGWFDHWMNANHETVTPDFFATTLERIFGHYNGSVNYYMFIGGTTFGFMAGANRLPTPPFYYPDVSSYDYDAPLTEAGDYTEKYHRLTALQAQYAAVPLKHPEMPAESNKTAYPSVSMQRFLDYDDVIDRIPMNARFRFDEPVSMEMLPMNDDSGQSYGYILYRKRYAVGNGTRIKIGRARDIALLIVDGRLMSTPLENRSQILTEFGYWWRDNQETTLDLDIFTERNVDLLVENWSRVNFGIPLDFRYRKGLHEGTIQIDNEVMTGLEIMALEFKGSWVRNLTGWRAVTNTTTWRGPVLLQSDFQIQGTPMDTWLDMSAWHKGIVFVNGFHIGRYFKAGPPTTMYIPAPLLRMGLNTITIFEHYKPASNILFVDKPKLGNVASHSHQREQL